MNQLTGKVKCVRVDDIDTDQIFHASLLTIHDPNEIKKHIFGNLDKFESFGSETHQDEILVVGKNFGKGSTRQQAVTGFIAHGIQAIIGASFGPIYYSNAVNAGLLLIEIPNLENHKFEDGDEILISIETSKLENKTKNYEIELQPIPKPLLDIHNGGGLLELGKNWQL